MADKLACHTCANILDSPVPLSTVGIPPPSHPCTFGMPPLWVFCSRVPGEYPPPPKRPRVNLPQDSQSIPVHHTAVVLGPCRVRDCSLFREPGSSFSDGRLPPDYDDVLACITLHLRCDTRYQNFACRWHDMCFDQAVSSTTTTVYDTHRECKDADVIIKHRLTIARHVPTIVHDRLPVYGV